MNCVLHPGLTVERWRAMPLEKRLLHVVSELTRAKGRAAEGDREGFRNSVLRALELADLTTEVVDHKAPSFLKEWLRFRETLAGVYAGEETPDASEVIFLIRQVLDLHPGTHNLQLVI